MYADGKIEKMWIRSHSFLRKALWVIGIVAVAAVLLLNVIWLSEISYDAKEKVTISVSVLPSMGLFLLLGALVLLFSRISPMLARINETYLFFSLSALYLLLGSCLILFVDDTMRADAGLVYEFAQAVSRGDYTAFSLKGYLHRYPYQLGLLLYDQLMQKISDSPRILFFSNLLMILGINGCSWKISDRLFHDKLTNILTILFSFAFLPQFFFLLFGYGLIPGVFFLSLSFYWLLCYLQTDSIGSLIGMALSIGAAVVLKKNTLIGAAAIGIVLALQFLKTRRVRMLLGMAAVLLCATLPMRLITAYFEDRTGADLGEPCPSVLWVVMGTDLDNDDLRGPGWYDNTNRLIYIDADYDRDAAAVIGREKLNENLERMISRPVWMSKFLLHKNISQWCDPLYQSIWSGPLEDCQQYTHTPFLQSLYNDGPAEDCVMWYGKLLSLALWGFALLYLLLHGKHSEGWEVFFLYFIGGLIFHTFWEAKSQYTYPYAFCLIPFAMYAVAMLLRKIRTVQKREKQG